MQGAVEEWRLFAGRARTRNKKRFGLAALIALVIGLLWWQTQWPGLRFGLAILLAGQAGVALIYLLRDRQISQQTRRFRQTATSEELLNWFDGEAAFVKRAMLFETVSRSAGFVMLAYGFWQAAQNVWLAVLLGVIYPLTAYFGVARRNNASIASELNKQQRGVQATLAAESNKMGT